MKRDNLLIAGLGQCGNVLADLMRTVNERYTSIYINSSLGDIKGLRFADIDSNVFIYGGADGSGRNRERANKFILNDQVRLASFLKKYAQFKYILIFTAMGGGTGSGTVPEFIRTIKKIFPNMIINVVGVLPSLKEDNLQLKNALECCEELSEISNLINDIKFINNNKRDTYEEINTESIKLINKSYSMLGHDAIGSIDEDNLTNVTTSKGYGIVLQLPTNYSSLEDAISEAQEKSVFALPNDLDCEYGAINVTEKYNIADILELINADKTMFKTYGKSNLICLGGCETPNDDIEDIESELTERELKKGKNKNRGFSFKSKHTNNTKTNEKSETIEETKFEDIIDDDDIDNLFSRAMNDFKR